MRTAKVNLYKFDELPENIQEKILEELRNINVRFDDWYDFALEQYEEELSKMGYDNAKISFSGFWSQGDGASLTADIDIKQVSKRALTEDEYEFFWHYVYSAYSEGGVYRRDNRYYHEYSMSVGDVYFDPGQKLYEAITSDNDRLQSVADDIDARLQKLCNEMQKFILEEVREYSRKIYRSLEREYIYLTSDEAVREMIDVNNYEFTSDGKLAKSIYYAEE